MNMMQMMQKAQSIQKKLQETQSELSNIEVTGEAGGVKVVCDGQGKFKSIKLTKAAVNPENPDSVDDDSLEMLEDVITTAINQATNSAKAQMEQKMKAITGGISIPGLF